MLQWFTVVLLLASAANASGDYIADRQAAVSLVKAGKHDEALAAFLKLAETAQSDLQKSDALQQAALAAERLQQPDRALELARQIPLAPVSKTCQMQVLDSERKYQEIVDRFGQEEISGWPESVQGDACFVRGHAFYSVKNGPAAEKDLRQAAEYLTDHNSKGLCLNQLGDTYRFLLKDDARAVATYRRTYSTGNVYKQCQAAISVADVLKEQQKPTAAVAELERIDLKEVTAPYWRGAMLRAFAQALAAAGRKADAIARCQEALALEGLPQGVRVECEKLLKDLQPDG